MRKEMKLERWERKSEGQRDKIKVSTETLVG